MNKIEAFLTYKIYNAKIECDQVRLFIILIWWMSVGMYIGFKIGESIFKVI